uniref:Membrane-fusion protein n=1 Tax=Malaco herpesvirus 2 TaxID=3031798 RepID=A0AA48P7S1_9VIRU|nr:TPA_asm: membrane-fusion protein [Malaco herpesvirus 2]
MKKVDEHEMVSMSSSENKYFDDSLLQPQTLKKLRDFIKISNIEKVLHGMRFSILIMVFVTFFWLSIMTLECVLYYYYIRTCIIRNLFIESTLVSITYVFITTVVILFMLINLWYHYRSIASCKEYGKKILKLTKNIYNIKAQYDSNDQYDSFSREMLSKSIHNQQYNNIILLGNEIGHKLDIHKRLLHNSRTGNQISSISKPELHRAFELVQELEPIINYNHELCNENIYNQDSPFPIIYKLIGTCVVTIPIICILFCFISGLFSFDELKNHFGNTTFFGIPEFCTISNHIQWLFLILFIFYNVIKVLPISLKYCVKK